MKSTGYCRIFPVLMLLATLFPAACGSFKPPRVYTIGVVSLNAEQNDVLLGFKRGLAKSGYVEGKNLIIKYNGSRVGVADLDRDLRSFIEQRVDLILTLTTPATKRAKLQTAESGIPVIFAPVFEPVGAGIVGSLVHPGGNLTGVRVGGNAAKALEWLVKISPNIKNICVPFNSNNEATVQSLAELQQAADKMGIRLTVYEVRSRDELENLFTDLPSGLDALWLLNSHFLTHYIQQYVGAAIKYKLPFGSSTSLVREGVMVSYGQNLARTGELAAGLAQKILKGRLPDSLPVENTDFFLGINLVTADRIGIDISDDILHVADTIIRQ